MKRSRSSLFRRHFRYRRKSAYNQKIKLSFHTSIGNTFAPIFRIKGWGASCVKNWFDHTRIKED